MAHGAVAPLHAGHARGEKPPAVAGALIHRIDADVLEASLQLPQRQHERVPRARAPDLEPPGGCIDIGDVGQVITDEEHRVAGVDRPEIRERRLEVRGTKGTLDEGFFPWKRTEDLLAARCARRDAGVSSGTRGEPSCSCKQGFTSRQHSQEQLLPYAARAPEDFAAASVMYSPCLVLPYHWSPWQW